MGLRSVFFMLRTPWRSTSSPQIQFMACTTRTATLLVPYRFPENSAYLVKSLVAMSHCITYLVTKW